MSKLVVAIGGNSLIKDAQHMSVPDQYAALGETSAHIARIIKDGWDVAIGHGNGPQVGFILRRSELAAHELHEVPLDVCDADSQGAIGYELQQNLANDFRRLGIDRRRSPSSPRWRSPPTTRRSRTRPSRSGRSSTRRRRSAARREGWVVREDAGRGWRRVVASPRPVRIVEELAPSSRSSTTASSSSPSAAAASPSSPTRTAILHGVAAVIDKDLASVAPGHRVSAPTCSSSARPSSRSRSTGASRPSAGWTG